MNRLAFLLLGLSALCPASLRAGVLVDFKDDSFTLTNANMRGYSSSVLSVPYSETALRSPSAATYNASDKPSGNFYGGALTDSSRRITTYAVQKPGTNWTTSNWINAQAGTSGNGLGKKLWMLTMWQQADFANGYHAGSVELGDGSQVMTARHRPGMSGLATEVRLVIKRAGEYFISNVISTATGTVFATAAVAAPETLSWNSYAPLTNLSVIGGPVALNDFSGLQAVGLLVVSTAASIDNAPKIELGQISFYGRMASGEEPAPEEGAGAAEESVPDLPVGAYGSARPILLMGDPNNYGIYERNLWIGRLLLPNQMDFVNTDGWVSPAKWSDYSAVLIANGTTQPAALSAEEDAAARRFVENGGVLIFAEGGLTSLLKTAATASIPQAWRPVIGAANTGSVSSATGTAVYQPTDNVAPWPADAGPSFTSPPFGPSSFRTLSNLTTARSLVVSPEGQTLIAINRYGAGHILFYGRQLFRFSDPSLSVLSNALERTLWNLNIPRASAINFTEVREKTGATGRYLAWKGDPQVDVALYPVSTTGYWPRFSPLWPQASQKLAALAVDLGRKETYATSFNVFAFENLSRLKVSLRSASGQPALPNGAVEVFWQDFLTETAGVRDIVRLDQEKFWLKKMPAEGEPLAAGENGIVWLSFHAAAWASSKPYPETFALILTLDDGSSKKEFPVTVRIYPVEVSETGGYRLGFYGFYTLNQNPFSFSTLANGQLNSSEKYTLGASTSSASSAAPILDAAFSLGSRTINGTALDLNAVKLGTGNGSYTGMTLKQFQDLRVSNPSLSILLNSTTVRNLDFSGLDSRMQTVREQGFFRMQYRTSLMEGTTGVTPGNNLVTNLTGINYGPGEVPATALSAQWRAANIGIWKQYREYLETKGFTEFVLKYGDELGTSGITGNWKPLAESMKAAGWKAEVNLTNSSATSQSVLNAIQDTVGVLQLNENFVDSYAALDRSGMSPDTLVTFYGSWGYYKSPAFYLRKQLWRLWATEFLAGMDIYTFDRLQVLCADGTQRTEVLSGSSEGIRNGWWDAAYLRLLNERIAAVADSTDPLQIAWREKAFDFQANSIAPDAGRPPPNPDSPYYHGMYWRTLPVRSTIPQRRELMATTAQMDQSKKDLLELLTASNPGAPQMHLQSVVSRKIHGASGPLDLALPASGAPGVESRSGDGACTLIFTFDEDVLGGQVEVIGGQAALEQPPSFSGAIMTVRLRQVADGQTVTLKLAGILAASTHTFDGEFAFRALSGDVDANGAVEVADRIQVQKNLGRRASATLIREDVNGSGGVSAADVMVIQQRLGASQGP